MGGPAHGMSIVELMVGVAIGLFILAGATLMVTGQLSGNRRLLADTQLQQDLRVAADIISRDLRRAAYTAAAYQSVWPSSPAAGLINAYADMTPESTGNPVQQLTYSSSKATNPGQENNQVDPDEISGFRLNAAHQTLEMQLGSGNWQALSDPNAMLITRFDISVVRHDQDVPCGADPSGTNCIACPATYGRCAQGPIGLPPRPCPLRLTTREVSFVLVGQSAIDPTVTRSLQWTVRPRNDVVREAC